jgi:FAD/FMN-containing dehydrogenase
VTSGGLVDQVNCPLWWPAKATTSKEREAGAAELTGYNRAWVRRPEVVVGATSTSDVVAAVQYAAREGRGLAVQSTGHGLVDEAAGSVLVSTRRMKDLAVDPGRRTARVSAGVVWAEVVQAAARHGLAPLNGSFPKVGVMGFTLGGGLGPMSRAYGFAADHVNEIELVTAEGQVRTIDEDTDPELFWGLRGGKGNFGVVTEMEFGLVPVARLYGGGIYYRAEVAADILHTYIDWTRGLPDEMTSSICLLRLPDDPGVQEPLRGRFVVHLRIAYLGDARAGEALVAPLRAVGGILVDGVREMPYTEVGTIHEDPTDPLPFWERSAMLAPPSSGDLDALLSVAGLGIELPLSMVELRHIGGGAVGRRPQRPNAVGSRDAEFCLLTVGILPDQGRGESGSEDIARASAAVMRAMAACDTGATLLNFQGSATEHQQVRRAFDPDAYTRLRRLKQLHDPDQIFGFGHAIPASTQE